MARMKKLHGELVSAMAKLEASHRAHTAAEEKLRGRASEQLDTMGEALHTCGQHIEADAAGGFLGHRRAATLLTERARLERVAARKNGES